MINTGETVRVTARPFSWEGVLDGGAQVSFSVEYKDSTEGPIPMAWDAMTASYAGKYITQVAGKHLLRIVAVMSDGTRSVETRSVEVKS